MSDKKITPVILCGGSGSRLWPVSRASFPKQLFGFGAQTSLLQDTITRVSSSEFNAPIVITNNEYRFLVAEQIAALDSEAQIILEPISRDSCAAIIAGAKLAQQHDPEGVVLVLAADHAMPDMEGFLTHVRAGIAAAQAGHIVTFGIHPTAPSVSYGYLRAGEEIPGSAPARHLDAFVEKPDSTTAQSYLDQGYLWNSGNFMFRASTFLDEARKLAPAIAAPAEEAVAKASVDLDFIRLDQSAFERAEALSVDYAVMEKTSRAAVIPSDFAWSDVGAWNAIWELAPKDEAGNVSHGDGLFHNARNSYINSPHALTAVLGLEDVVVINTRDALLVAHRDHAQDVKKIVGTLKQNQRSEAVEHKRTYRPWGDYEQIDEGHRYQVKRISVKPGGKLSLQSHKHRAEHWVVVTGTARVTVDERVEDLGPNQSTYIPLGAIHRLENPGDVVLELIEVQSGSYLGEDDIIRYEDVYNRE